jgi:hypothetical protein
MMKKLMIGVAPLLAVAAFMVVPAMASAQPVWTVNGKPLVKPDAPVPVASFGGPATLEYSGKTITCNTVDDEGYLLPPETLFPRLPEPPFTNSTGQDEDDIYFLECENNLGEPVTVKNPVEVVTFLVEEGGNIVNKYLSASGTDVFAELENPTGSGLKKVTGSVPVSGVVNGNKLEFEESENLEIENEKAAFKLTTEQFGIHGEEIGAES